MDNNIGNIVNSLVNKSRMLNCSLEYVWNNHTDSEVKEKFTFDDVLHYLEDDIILSNIERRINSHNGKKYSLDDIRRMFDCN